jgi:hypothetical protein
MEIGIPDSFVRALSSFRPRAGDRDEARLSHAVHDANAPLDRVSMCLGGTCRNSTPRYALTVNASLDAELHSLCVRRRT